MKSTGPYKDASTNLIYQLLFCDNLALYEANNTAKELYPWPVLFDDHASPKALQGIIEDDSTESRTKILSFRKLHELGEPIEPGELYGVIVEVGLEGGLDVLASYKDGSARYINYTGSMIIWDTNDETSGGITSQLFSNSLNIVRRIGPWPNPRRPHPAQDTVRISFLVSDGLYFGEGPVNVLFQDALAAPALSSATALMNYLTQKALK
jgi:hypothetical protein